ncbi:hypothetical protein G6O45_27250, partial [Salmonella enterica subsp. enterica serovar Istanbul]|nr:hypothetical protein [Salmonella enterica subsp. enterica serovar Istanbul]
DMRSDESDAELVLDHLYVKGDYLEIAFEPQTLPCFRWIQVDAALRPSLVYFTQTPWRYDIPTNYLRVTEPDHESIFPEMAFAGREHVIRIWRPDVVDLKGERNLALNCHDQAA